MKAVKLAHRNGGLFSRDNAPDFKKAVIISATEGGPVLDAESAGQKLNIASLLDARAKQTVDVPESTLNCSNCGHVITAPGERIEISGQHAHTFSNPHGIQFRIGCFADAIGVIAQGPPTKLWSWFSGYRWQISQCRQCRQHLGWRFTNSHNSHSFFALILMRLVEMENNARNR